MTYYYHYYDIHENSPTVDTAMAIFERELEYAQESGAHVFIAVIGYGSTGGTHKIADAVMDKLAGLKYDQEILDYIRGSDLGNPNKRISHKFINMLSAEEKRIANPGVVYIFLRK